MEEFNNLAEVSGEAELLHEGVVGVRVGVEGSEVNLRGREGVFGSFAEELGEFEDEVVG